MDRIKIYLSYSHVDKDLASQFFDYLSKENFEVLWDENIVMTGDNFNQKLMMALSDADIYLPIISENFDRSVYAKREFLTAIGYNSSKGYPKIFPYIVFGNRIPIDLSYILCFIGTQNIDNDLKKIGSSLLKLSGEILADKKTNIENSETLNESLDVYLKDAFEQLEKNEIVNKRLAYISYIFSAVFLLSIVGFGIIRLLNEHNYEKFELSVNILYSLQGIIIITVLAALSRLSFILGKSFMVESIRNGDRIHAINFGKFFIRAYGKVASRQEIKEVLGEWNIDKGSSFHTQDAKEIDPNILGVLELLKSQKTK